jgi:hypothetical protein
MTAAIIGAKELAQELGVSEIDFQLLPSGAGGAGLLRSRGA